MARFSKLSKPLSKEEQDLILQLCEALTALNSTEEAAKFLTDLLSNAEARMLARRLEIAKRLLDGWKFSDIENSLKVGTTTISRVGEWLKIYGEGYRLVEKRTKKRKPTTGGAVTYAWRDLKKRFPLTFWPDVLIEDLIKNANRKQRERVRTVLKTMDSKSELYKKIDKALRMREDED